MELKLSYYQRNKERIKIISKASKARARARFNEFKSNLSCTVCKQSHPATLDFHHKVRSADKLSINVLTKNGAFNRAIEEIMNKCIVLCANCHRIHHYDERIANKKEAEASLPST